MIKCILTIIGIIIAIIISLCINDDVEVIDNTYGCIICGNTGEPCIKDILYTKYNNCNECPYDEQ